MAKTKMIRPLPHKGSYYVDFRPFRFAFEVKQIECSLRELGQDLVDLLYRTGNVFDDELMAQRAAKFCTKRGLRLKRFWEKEGYAFKVKEAQLCQTS